MMSRETDDPHRQSGTFIFSEQVGNMPAKSRKRSQPAQGAFRPLVDLPVIGAKWFHTGAQRWNQPVQTPRPGPVGRSHCPRSTVKQQERLPRATAVADWVAVLAPVRRIIDRLGRARTLWQLRRIRVQPYAWWSNPLGVFRWTRSVFVRSCQCRPDGRWTMRALQWLPLQA